MSIYAIMGSKGEYSDRWVFTIGYTTDEERAKAIVLERAEADRLKHSIENAKSKLSSQAIALWDIDHPYPSQNHIIKPQFDQGQHKNKQYIEEHIARKRVYEQQVATHYKEIYEPWMLARNEWSNAYVEANFTMDLCEPPEWTDAQYWYETLEELI